MMARAGHAVDAEGRDVYLPKAKRMALPISFIHDSENLSVFPESTERTVAFLSELNGDGYYRRRLIDGYGHLDCIIG
jgi:cholesterol oxidase